MSQVDFAIVYADVPGFPAGTVVSGVLVGISGPSAASQTVPDGTTAVTFPDLAVGTYTYSVAALDASSAVLGTAVTGTFDIPVPATVTLSLPSTATATVS